MNNKRKKDLVQMASNIFNGREYFNYEDWDSRIECYEELTLEELDWLRENAIVTVQVSWA